MLGGELSSLAGRPSSPALHGPLSWQIARRANLEMRGKLKPRGCPVLGAWLSAGSPAVRSSNTGGPGGFYPHPRSPSGLSWLYKRWVGGLDEAGSQSRIPSWRVLSRFWGSWDRDFGEGRPQDGYPGREGALGLPLPAPAALGLRSGGCSSKLRQVSTSSPRGGGRARHSEVRTASASWHRGPPAPHTPLMPQTPRPAEQQLEPAPRPDWGGARRPQEDPPCSGPLRLRSAFNHFPAGSPPLTWHPAAAGKSGASRPPPLHSGTGLSPGSRGFEAGSRAVPNLRGCKARKESGFPLRIHCLV